RFKRLPGQSQELIRRDNEYTPVVWIRNAVNVADSPGFSHVSVARKHPAIKRNLYYEYLQPGILSMKWLVGNFADPLEGLFQVGRLPTKQTVHKGHSHGQLTSVIHTLKALDVIGVRSAVAHCRKTDRVKVTKHFEQPLII